MNVMINEISLSNYSEVESISSNFSQNSKIKGFNAEVYISKFIESKMDEGIALF